MKIPNKTIRLLSLATLLVVFQQVSGQTTKTISSKTLAFHVPEKEAPEIKQEVKRQVENKEQKIQDELEEYLDKLLQNNQISKNLQATVNVTIVNDKTASGDIEQNLHAKYNYEILNNPGSSLKSQIDDYPSGKYRLGSSKAAMSTMEILKQTIETNLSEFLTKDTKVTVKITGTTDASQVKGSIPYTNEYGSIEDYPYYLNNQLNSVSVSQQSGITTNEQLGLLRTLGVRQFMETYIEPLKNTQNSYQHYVQTTNEIGGKNRRVTIELIIHDAMKHFQSDPSQLAAGATTSQKKSNELEIKNSDVDVNIPVNTTENENTYALIIGNEDYASQQTDLDTEANVDFARHDAEVFKEYCLKMLGLKEEHIFFMKDATAVKMNRGINRMAQIADVLHGNMNMIVYYSGHGLPDEQTKEAYLIPVDVSGAEITSGIKVEDMYQRLTKNSPNRVTVFLDACFSGGGRNKGLLSLKGVKVKPKEDVLDGNLVVLTSSTGEESSTVYKDKCHGMFTYYLLKKMQESKGNMTYKELYDYVNTQVKLQSVVINSKIQTPTVSGSNAVIDTWQNWKLK
ncbi:MAG: caspase family protein [Bacteroidota bacterium]|nr:caspase family protein [Bacteroidota bacterium]